MGAADIVPGVSGGTIAFITGIYFRLLDAINQVPVAFWRHLCRGRPVAFWQACDGTFLATLLAGILFSVVSLASLITYALETHPVPLWSFFFGLILASVWHVAREIRDRRAWLLLAGAVGFVFAWWVTSLTTVETTPTAWVLFGSGAVAICAMILPGISGSFILVVLGMYAPVLEALRELALMKLAIFSAGCVVGLLSIARLLTWAVQRHHDLVLAVLTGVMIGSLNKVWPWKQTLSWRTNSAGEQVPVEQVNVMPQQFAEVTGASSELGLAIAAALAGLLLVVSVEWLAARLNRR
ncbi:MAG: DUF368 domain-containing protein [Marinobacter sp.]|uniref:DUF368 domain-containing protein n=1 Tax=Marinobacter sp. TaxID=50741 RepID=UPI00299DD01F|nr:DUF368 domain-containing protein [Marinobacter sp.]MDX1635326.1 DUF368 domain-containing protein [Marinobacter sp.]